MAQRILVIEDEVEIAGYLRRGLAMEGYQVVVAADGPAGLVAAREHPPDLVILDVMLPKLDGLAVAERDVRELDTGLGREIRRRTGSRDELGQAGQMIGLHVCLEDGDDRCADFIGCLEVAVDELGVRFDDGELPVRQAAEEVARARRLGHEELAKDHLDGSVRPLLSSHQAKLTMAAIG